MCRTCSSTCGTIRTIRTTVTCPGACQGNVNSFVYCNCWNGISVNEPSIGLNWCSADWGGYSYCQLATPPSATIISWWSTLYYTPPQLAEASVGVLPVDSPVFQVVSYPLDTWSDAFRNNPASQTNPALQPTFEASPVGQPGMLFTPSAVLQAPAIWPTQSNYSISLILQPSTIANCVIAGSSTHSVSLINGAYYLVHNGQQASAPASSAATTNSPVHLQVTYSDYSRAVQYWINGYAAGSATMSYGNTDAALSIGSGFSGFVWDVQIHADAISSQSVLDNWQYLAGQAYCQLFQYC